LQDLEIGQLFEVLALSSETADVEDVNAMEFATGLRSVE
jgi:hypothetical protein